VKAIIRETFVMLYLYQISFSLFLAFASDTCRMEIFEVIHILEKRSKEGRQREINMRTSHY